MTPVLPLFGSECHQHGAEYINLDDVIGYCLVFVMAGLEYLITNLTDSLVFFFTTQKQQQHQQQSINDKGMPIDRKESQRMYAL